jgi:sRNA-binding protein
VINALYFYTGRLRYRESLTEGAPRFNIVGQPVGTVTQEETTHAAQLVEQERARRAALPSGLSDLRMAARRRRAENETGPVPPSKNTEPTDPHRSSDPPKLRMNDKKTYHANCGRKRVKR